MRASLNGVMETFSLQHVGKRQLVRDFSALVGKDRGCTADMLVYIGEMDRRKLYLEHAYPSMFAFCTKRFRMSEAVAAKRIRGGRKKNGGRSRAIPAYVRREVFKRDEGRCAFVNAEGRRCESAWQLEFHHCVPYGREGPHSTGNIELRCRAHNQFEAELEYGRELMEVRRGCGDGG